ncbi:centrosomal protein of 95 kDa-like [Rhinichthys klamathensis goyatoka]|uniref:centrosomal protein of 95 kDa-like n=1 Tax=Rhinichthys klamathensis goyatoka TaxID=3034132 RepID=UPI0024B4D789|nr:centrosomal protein of 95 kDa-like [Rhinichthys klamathensis goyatoka]
MGSDEKDWVDVANNVLLKCHINLRLERISECDANVFVALYEAILGEKVPDCVAAERQEDDIHNVQSVIDSLALDYLQISLSHITGENIVRGEKESIRNLLEIFDGLLDYLIEQQSDEEPQIKGLNGKNSDATATLQPRNQDRDNTQCRAFSFQSALQSSERSLCSWNGDEFKSTTELIKLRDSGCMFMAKQEVLPAVLPQVETLENAVSTQTTLLRESLWPTIPLQPPYQTTTQRPPSSTDMALFSEEQTIQQPENSCHKIGHSSEWVQINGELNTDVSMETEKFEFCQRVVHSEESEDQGKVDTRPILFCTKPGRHREVEEKEEREEEQANRSTDICMMHTDERQGARQKSDGDSSLSLRSQRNKEAERELHDMSEKLSQRLEELDLMLKRALGEVGEMCEPEEEDKQSHHSDSIMERRTPKNIGSCHARAHAHSLLDSPPTAQRSFQQDALIKDHSQLRQKNTQIPRSCIKSSCSRSSRTRLQQTARRETHSLRVKENNLLPILLDEFPQVQLSPHTLSRMWKQQLRQIDQLNSSKNQSRHILPKRLNQLEEAQKRHDMLVQIIRKEQEHNSRLRVFRESIQQQKFAQNKLREQRQQFARAKKYYSIYHVQLRAKLMQAKTQEERKLKQIFEEGLERQKAHLREQRAYSKELLQENYRKYQDEIEAMENYYRDQFSLLAETLAHERQDIQIRTKAQEKALQKMKRELRNKMEKEIGELQKIIIQNDENNYFRDLEVERLRKHVQMASFQYTTR